MGYCKCLTRSPNSRTYLARIRQCSLQYSPVDQRRNRRGVVLNIFRLHRGHGAGCGTGNGFLHFHLTVFRRSFFLVLDLKKSIPG